MSKNLIWFLKNNIVFWVFFTVLTIGMVFFVLKKEGIRITITLSQPYDNKVISIFGD